MEDQPTDSGDLAAAAPVPQGKAGRTRHRLPRAKLRQDEQDAGSEEAVAEAATAEWATESTAAESEPPVDTGDARPEVVEPQAEVAPGRRRFPWRKSTPAAKPSADAEPEVLIATDDDTDTTASDSEVSDGEAFENDGVEAVPELVLVPHRTAGRGLKVAAIVAGALFIGAAAFAGATVQPYLADRAEVHTKFVVAETAARAITTLWTYTPEDMDSLPDRASKFLAGDFAVEYRRYIDAIVEPNKQAQVSNDTQVLGAAVESLTPTEASAIVYTNSVATSPVTKGIPSLRYLSYRLQMELRNRQWLITKMTAVTSLDLTPRL